MNSQKYKLLVLIVFAFIAVGFYSGLDAQTTTTNSKKSSSDDLTSAQQALDTIIQQGPPVTTPSLPEGTKSDSTSKLGTTCQVLSPLSNSKYKSTTGNKLLPEGHYISNRRGRLVKRANYWLFIFESDGKALSDPPLKLLPNRWLEKMESDTTSSHQKIIFQVSGEITVYHGENYLLLRKVLIERGSVKRFK
jgi:hypothetical protein